MHELVLMNGDRNTGASAGGVAPQHPGPFRPSSPMLPPGTPMSAGTMMMPMVTALPPVGEARSSRMGGTMIMEAPSYPRFQPARGSTQAVPGPSDSEPPPRTLFAEPEDRTMMADMGGRTMIGSFAGGMPNAQPMIVNVTVDPPPPFQAPLQHRTSSSAPPAAQYASMARAAMAPPSRRKAGMSATALISLGLLAAAIATLVITFVVLG